MIAGPPWHGHVAGLPVEGPQETSWGGGGVELGLVEILRQQRRGRGAMWVQ